MTTNKPNDVDDEKIVATQFKNRKEAHEKCMESEEQKDREENKKKGKKEEGDN